MDYKYIGKCALKALLYEVSTSPKPGLVDCYNSGSHNDMDFYTFMASAASLADGFQQLAKLGNDLYNESTDDLLVKVRTIGLEMENEMFIATKGINTHKGMIFSLGLVTFVAAKLLKESGVDAVRAENIFKIVSQITKGICDAELNHKTSVETHGEKVFLKYRITGIRGEVEAGFPTLDKKVLDEIRNGGYNYGYQGARFLQILFLIMSKCEDSTILHRHDLETLDYVKKRAESFIMNGGMLQPDSFEQVNAMDKEFIEKKISPGGSADLLAVSIMIGLLEGFIQ